MDAIATSDIEERFSFGISNIQETIAQQNGFDIPKNKTSLSGFLADKMLIIYIIRKGVPYYLFSVIQDYAPFTENDRASLPDVSTKSLQRYKQDARHFRPFHSEKIIEISEVTSLGLEVFGNMDKFKGWLHTPNFALGRLTPIELLKDSYGKEMVVAELTHIHYGILS